MLQSAIYLHPYLQWTSNWIRSDVFVFVTETWSVSFLLHKSIVNIIFIVQVFFKCLHTKSCTRGTLTETIHSYTEYLDQVCKTASTLSALHSVWICWTKQFSTLDKLFKTNSSCFIWQTLPLKCYTYLLILCTHWSWIHFLKQFVYLEIKTQWFEEKVNKKEEKSILFTCLHFFSQCKYSKYTVLNLITLFLKTVLISNKLQFTFNKFQYYNNLSIYSEYA